MNHLCLPITPDQLQLLNSQAPFAFAISKVISNYFLPDLATDVCQYQFYKDTQYTLRASVKSLEDKAQHYLEGTMEVLSDLENAYVLGHLLAHANIISANLLACDAQVYTHYTHLMHSFKGDITQSALDVCINPSHHNKSRPMMPMPCKVVLCRHPTTSWKEAIDSVIQAEANCLDKDDRRAHTNNRPCPIIPSYLQKRCFHCGSHGHIRTCCPCSNPLLPRL